MNLFKGNRIIILLCQAILISVCFQAGAKPVHNKKVPIVQPDGKEIEAVINGDEFFRTITDTYGHSLIKGDDGFFYYALYNSDGSRYSSGFIAGEEAPAHILNASLMIPHEALRLNARRKRAALGPARARSVSVARAGLSSAGTRQGPVRKHCLVLLVEFKDKKMGTGRTREDFVNLITRKGYSEGGAIGSAADYFEDQFRGDYEFSFTISPFLTLSKNCAYYYANSGNDTDVNSEQAVKEACELAKAEGIDFSQFDDDGDGEVDNVFLFVAGKDEADSGDEDCVWSHQFYLEGTDLKGFSLDGKVINTYAVSTELRLAGSRYIFTSIGTFCHEYSHTLGFADIYDTDYEGSGGYCSGMWRSTALMDGGNSNDSSARPPYYNALDCSLAGIGNAETLKAGEYTLEPISRNRRFLKFETGTPGEYYLIECRNNEKWDEFIGGKGLLIYHIDRSSRNTGRSETYGVTFTAEQRWEYNEVNCRPDHECAKVMTATPGIKAYDSGGHPQHNTDMIFFPQKNATAFTSKTDPAFVFWDGTESPLAITNIAFSGENVTFTVTAVNGTDFPKPILGEKQIFQDAAILQWTSSDEGYTANATVSWGKSGGEMTEVEVSPYEPGKYAVTLEGLSPKTAYKVSICFKQGSVSGEQVPLHFTSKSLYDNGFPFIFLSNAARNEDGSLKSGAKLPLRIYNLSGADGVSWFFDGKAIKTGPDGYYHVSGSGMLKAEISGKDGSKDVIIKEITVK